ncbi:UNVERIFIED_CONTAM: hypothetical protein GTU68_037914 [Idotea baltica]|nr:hypothetical protein [Idotea baltica]
MIELAQTMRSNLGLESKRNDQGYGVTVSYWESAEDVRLWKSNEDRRNSREKGKGIWNEPYAV